MGNFRVQIFAAAALVFVASIADVGAHVNENARIRVNAVADENAPQRISGRVFNASTGAILPYATVEVRGKNVGVIVDRNGRFELPADKNFSPADTVLVSHVGFDTEMRTVAQMADCQWNVSLRAGVYKIDPVVVTNRPGRLAKLGHSSAGTGFVNVGWRWKADTISMGRKDCEIGAPIKIKHDSEIISFGMYVRQNDYKRALLRLSFYELNGRTPGQLIVNKDIKFEIADQKKGRIEIDLSPYGIRFEGGREVLVALALLDEEMGGSQQVFMLSGALLGRSIYGHVVGHEKWDILKTLAITMYLNARVYR